MPINPETLLEDIRMGRVVLTCGIHNYVAAKTRNHKTVVIPPVPNGCPKCWKAYYVTDYVFTMPEKREENLDQLTGVIHRVVEFEDKGKFGDDFELYDPKDPRFQVKIDKDVV